MRQIAEDLGVSVATVSRALRQDPLVRESTRVAILKQAAKIGYELNPYLGSLMSSIRKGQSQAFKGNIGVLWRSGIPSAGDDPRLLQIQAGVQAGAERLGYRVDEFSLKPSGTAALSRVLTSRGIGGVLVTVPAFSAANAHLRFDFEKFSTVCLGWGLLRPALHTVRFDYFHAVRLALHYARRGFGSGLAALWDGDTDRRAHRIARGAFVIHHPAGPAVGHKLFLNAKTIKESATRTLFLRHQVKCLLIERGVEVPDWIRRLIPPENFVLFMDPGIKQCFGWIDTQNFLLGSWGAELLVSKLSQRETGIPPARQVLLVPPIWRSGREGNSA